MKFLRKLDFHLRRRHKGVAVQLGTRQTKPSALGDLGAKPTALSPTKLFKELLAERTCTEQLAQLELQLHMDQWPKFPNKMNKKRYFMYNGSFHEAVGGVLLVAEFFALMPVLGVTSHHPRHLSFSWTHLRTWYSVMFIVVTVFDSALTLYKIGLKAITFNTIEPLIFRISIVIVCCSGLQLAHAWPQLMEYWRYTEDALPAYSSQIDKRRLSYKIKMITIIAMLLSLGEHLMNLISVIHYSNYCPVTKEPIKNFFLLVNDQLFFVFPYSSWLAAFGKVDNVMQTFIWNYMDVFVMIVSIGLASLFKQLNDNLIKFKGMQMPASFWTERRVQYRKVCMLLEKVDNAISIITMVSFSNNLYFICVQLLKSLNKMPSVAHALYFYYSLSFLIGRTLAVSLCAAAVHDESRRPLRVLRCVPKESWCAEVKRFADDISSNVVALSGMKFFHLTRGLVLSVAGTIVTYELVLIQFREDTNLWDCDQQRRYADLYSSSI